MGACAQSAEGKNDIYKNQTSQSGIPLTFLFLLKEKTFKDRVHVILYY